MRFERLSMIALLLATTATTSCTSERCKTDSDCFVPEVCVERSCEPPVVTADQADMRSSMSAMDMLGPDSTSSDVDMRRDFDLGAPDAGVDANADLSSMDMTTAADLSFESCEIDPFTFICSDDDSEPNNLQVDAEPLGSQGAGCPPGIDFRPFSGSVDGTVCPADGTDWYRLNFTECFDKAFIIELQVELLSDCDPNIVGLRTPQFDCADDLVQCTIEDGKPTLRAILERTSGPATRSLYVEVHNKMQQDITFDYELSVEVRE